MQSNSKTTGSYIDASKLQLNTLNTSSGEQLNKPSHKEIGLGSGDDGEVKI